ncbi:hypothetical protein BO71DRAFT_323179 [Aspergillus ellipticus CBS 707.79]|uniref:N-acetyltransferase domain-containing protein n=1 Tax=Aspergillus ellipticus CBS 707.79 TaxID=1448320 RepID=A0A319DDE4_9EURO|nr:hypothetical protein BO71DRAFT_323179 [Aspergillus ellipticus CBS 707.79]
MLTVEELNMMSQEEVQAVLRRVQQEATYEIFNRRDLYYITANPEALGKCRDGPGTNVNSNIYRKISQRRNVWPDQEGDSDGVPRLPPKPSEEEGESDDDMENLERLKGFDNAKVAWWEAFEQTAHAYPTIVDGKVTLTSEPNEEQEELIPKLCQFDQHPHASQNPSDVPNIAFVRDWRLGEEGDWEYYPYRMYHAEAWKRTFRRWLDDTVRRSCYANMFHEAFFDGTGHPDGVRSFYVPQSPDISTVMDPADEEGLLHRHETAEGYCRNMAIHHRKEQEKAAVDNRRAREAYLGYLQESEKNPHSPKAKVYFRPAEMRDVPQLIPILNWFAKNSTVSGDLTDVQPADVRERITTAKNAKLPFILAVERKDRRAATDDDKAPEKLFGYALVTDYMDPESSGKYTVQLEMFVIPEQQRLGIGRCLLDKVKEICDPSFTPRAGYFFNISREERHKYGLGGQRVLARLMVVLSFVPEDRPKYKWVKEWLEKHGFELQGQLKGARVKDERFLDVNYLVRNSWFIHSNYH